MESRASSVATAAVGGGVGGGGVGKIVDVVLMVVLCARRNRGVVLVVEGDDFTRWTNDRINFEERPLVVMAINGRR